MLIFIFAYLALMGLLLFLIRLLTRAYFRSTNLRKENQISDQIYLNCAERTDEILDKINFAFNFVIDKLNHSLNYPLVINLLDDKDWMLANNSPNDVLGTLGHYDPNTFYSFGFHTINIPAEKFQIGTLVHELAHAVIEEVNPSLNSEANEELALFVDSLLQDSIELDAEKENIRRFLSTK